MCLRRPRIALDHSQSSPPPPLSVTQRLADTLGPLLSSSLAAQAQHPSGTAASQQVRQREAGGPGCSRRLRPSWPHLVAVPLCTPCLPFSLLQEHIGSQAAGAKEQLSSQVGQGVETARTKVGEGMEAAKGMMPGSQQHVS